MNLHLLFYSEWSRYSTRWDVPSRALKLLLHLPIKTINIWRHSARLCLFGSKSKSGYAWFIV